MTHQYQTWPKYIYAHKVSGQILGQIESEHPKLFALEFGKISESDFVYTLAFTNIEQSTQNLVKMYMTIKSRISSILGQIESEHPKLFALEFGKIAESDFVYTLASTNIEQSTQNVVKMYMTIRLQMSLIKDLIGPELYELFALEFENLPYLTLFTLCHLQILTNQYLTWPQYI